MKKLYYLAFAYLGLGLIFGVFYREFTVHHEFVGRTQLAFLHTHALVLGTMLFLIVLLFEYVIKISDYKKFNWWLIVYNIGFSGLLITMFIRGTGQVLSWELSGFNHIAGLFHAILGVSLLWFFVILGKKIKIEKSI